MINKNMEQMMFEKLKTAPTPIVLVEGPKLNAGVSAPASCFRKKAAGAPMCAECVEFTAGRCPGKTRAEVQPGIRPCSKYNLDYAVLDVTIITAESTSPPTTCGDRKDTEQKDGLEFLEAKDGI